MLLLSRTPERMEADRVRLLLESNGIPVFIGNENSKNNVYIAGHSLEYFIWIVIDEQFEDALALLKDESHEVTNPIDVKAYYRELEDNKANNLKKLLNALITIFLCLIFVIFILVKIYN